MKEMKVILTAILYVIPIVGFIGCINLLNKDMDRREKEWKLEQQNWKQSMIEKEWTYRGADYSLAEQYWSKVTVCTEYRRTYHISQSMKRIGLLSEEVNPIQGCKE